MYNRRRAPSVGFPMGGGRMPVPRGSILTTLQAADMSDRKRLPAEIIATILDYLPVADLVRCARASRRLREMVYDDSRWVARLRSMDCWDEAAARLAFEDAVRKRQEAERAFSLSSAGGLRRGGGSDNHARHTIFDATLESQRQEAERRSTTTIRDGFETLTLDAPTSTPDDPAALLDVFKITRSIRGRARQEYGRIYGALAPFYYDLVRASSHADPVVFKAFRDPERQAQMLANLQRFARSDWAAGWHEREQRLVGMANVFETAVLREFEQGYELWDVDGHMRRYAHVLHTLNGGAAAVDLFVQKHPILNDRRALPNPLDCINHAPQDDVSLEPSRLFFEELLARLNEQSAVIGRIFPEPRAVFWAFVDRVREDVVMEYTVPLFEQAHQRSVASYLKAVSGLFEQTSRFYGALAPPTDTSGDGGHPEQSVDTSHIAKAWELSQATFDPHLDTYLREELEYFVSLAEAEVSRWDRKLSEEHASAESFFTASLNRQATKKDFLSSFKKVVMMPVNVLPTTMGLLPFGSPFGAKPGGEKNGDGAGADEKDGTATPGSVGSGTKRSSIYNNNNPTAPDELAAKAALMQSRLEGIRSLFSIEVALNLVHAAQTSLGRIAVFVPLGGQWGGEAKEQCAAVFISMLRILGGKHIKAGFDMAVGRLSKYSPRDGKNRSSMLADRDGSTNDGHGAPPLAMFIELVNVGDLVSQMVDVFYEQQLVAACISDRNDFLDPASLAKKRFEQMLDESVAAGLNRGIDVLMDEVDYLNSTTQLPTDYNPGGASPAPTTTTTTAATTTDQHRHSRGPGFLSSSSSVSLSSGIDVGPSATAQQIIALVSDHVRMLAGSTEKSMLDVFNAEVGLRLFAALCKHLKRQRVSVDGAIRLIADMNLYFDFIRTLRNQDLLAYFRALRELSQIFLIDARHAKDMAAVIADGDRFGGIFRAEEVYEFAQRRADWYQVRRDVERATYGLECAVM